MKIGNVWQEIKNALFKQAPMEDVTDTVFRQMLASVAAPDLYFTEFTNVDGLASDYGRPRVAQRLKFSPIERPIVAQIWGKSPENYCNGARYIKELGFNGVDINMGCPQKDVIKKGLCAALIENHEQAARVIKATQEGAGGLPISIKTRIGIRNIATEDWISFLLGFDLASVIIHGRTVKEMSDVPAHWDEIGKAVVIRNSSGKKTLIIGNGDVKSREDGLAKVAEYGVDGVMIGRGMLEDIGVFSTTPRDKRELNVSQRLELLQKHMRLWESTWKGVKNFNLLKKYVKVYVKDFSGASDTREQCMKARSFSELEKVIICLLEPYTFPTKMSDSPRDRKIPVSIDCI